MDSIKYGFRVFLSSTFDKNMKINRDLFRAELTSRLNMLSGQIGFNTYLTDFEYGIPDGVTQEEMIDICLYNVKTADFFIGIIGENYGRQLNFSTLSGLAEEIVALSDRVFPHNTVSILDLEIMTAIQYVPAVFFVEKGKAVDPLTQNMLSFIFSKKCEVHYFDSYVDLTHMVPQVFRKYMGIANNAFYTSEIAFKQLSSRKLRYFCDENTIIPDIDAYICNDNLSILLIEGPTGTGKTTSICHWIRENISRSDIKIISWFSELGPKNFNGLIVHLLNQLGEDTSSCCFVDDAVNLFRTFLRKNQSQRYVFIIDGVDDVQDIEDPIGWLIGEITPMIKMIITSAHAPQIIKENRFIHTISSVPISSSSLIEKIYSLEGKQYEYPYVSTLLSSKLDTMPLNQVILSIQQFLREVKYASFPSTEFKAPWNENKISLYFDHFKSNWSIFKVQYLYLDEMQLFDQLQLSMYLIACSEKGLSSFELSEITQCEPHFIYQFYFSLYSNEDLYYFPDDIRDNILNNMQHSRMVEVREKIISYFREVEDDRAIIELYFQYMQLRQSKKIYRLISSLHDWKTISANTTIANQTNSAISEKMWRKIHRLWLKDIACNYNSYSEAEINTAYSCARTLGKLNLATEYILLLINHYSTKETRSLMSAYQVLADLYDELDDVRAVASIEKALENMFNYNSNLFPQDKVDIFLMAANIFSHFAFLQNCISIKNSDHIICKVKSCVEQAIQITENTWNVNPFLYALTYHNAAFALMNIKALDEAYTTIRLAIDCDTSSLSTKADSYFLLSQISLELYRFHGDKRYLEEAENSIIDCQEIEISYRTIRDEYDANAMQSKIHNQWADVLSEQKKFTESISHIEYAIICDKKINAHDIYRTYYNAGIFCLSECLNSKGEYYVLGKKYAFISLIQVFFHLNDQSRFDLCDIFILLSRLFRFKKHIFVSHFLLVISLLLGKNYNHTETPINVENIFSPINKFDWLLFKIENKIFDCFLI